MPRKYTRRNPSPDSSPANPLVPSVEADGRSTPTGALPVLDQVPATRVLSAMEEYGLWLKQNQHVTQALPPEPSQPRKAPNVPRPRY